MAFCAAYSYRLPVMKLPKFVSFSCLGSGLIDAEQKQWWLQMGNALHCKDIRYTKDKSFLVAYLLLHGERRHAF